MKKLYRIKDSDRIQTILDTRNKKADEVFSVYVKQNQFPHFRYALSVGKKFGNAVQRNIIKRQIRMILSEHVDRTAAMDVFIIIRPKASKLTYQSIENKVIKLLKAHKLIRGEKT